MNPLAQELNEIIQPANLHVYEMLSQAGKNLFFPKGILTQSAEAKERAHHFNATIGMATEKGRTMCLNLKTVEAESLRVHLLDKYGVGLISLGKHDLRVAFSCIEKQDVQELFDIVLKGVRDLEH